MGESTQNLNTVPETIRGSTPNDISEPEKKNFLSKKWLLLSSIILVLIIISAGAVYFFLNSNKQAACTKEAKLCPDGSSVGRTGPKCEFTACPAVTPIPTTTLLDTSDWKTYTNNLFTFKYPKDWNIDISTPSSIMIKKSIIVDGPTDRKTTYGAKINIYSSSITTNTNLDSWLNNRYLKGDTGPLIKQFMKNSTLSGQKAFRLTLPGAAAYQGEAVVSIYNGRGYDINLNGYSLQTAEEDFEGVISTFKFTDQTVASPNPTCRPRPACLDATPKCLIPETSDMCPPNSH